MKKWLLLLFLATALYACNEQPTENETFQSEQMTMIGVPNKAAILDEGQFPVIKGETNTFDFYFWGDQKTLLGTFDLEAIHKETGTTLNVYGSQNSKTIQPLYGADHHISALMSFPDSGTWRVDIKFDTAIYASIYVDVLDATK